MMIEVTERPGYIPKDPNYTQNGHKEWALQLGVTIGALKTRDEGSG